MAEKYLAYFDEFATEDIDDVLSICETASKIIFNRFRARFDDPKLLGATFSKIFEAITNKLEALESEYSDFRINICDRLQIGYSTTDDDDDEKQGNFMVSMFHLNNTKKNEDVDDPTMKSRERAVQWNTENITEQPELLRAISIDAIEGLKSIEVQLASSEIIMPIFVTTYEAIVNYLKIKREETNEFEYEINFISCFNIGARESEDGSEIYIRPNIESKLKIKNDNKASSKYES